MVIGAGRRAQREILANVRAIRRTGCGTVVAVHVDRATFRAIVHDYRIRSDAEALQYAPQRDIIEPFVLWPDQGGE